MFCLAQPGALEEECACDVVCHGLPLSGLAALASAPSLFCKVMGYPEYDFWRAAHEFIDNERQLIQ